ncbi:MAG: hypothetical protein LBL96_09590 [Clostridiales bacterium]|jgi:hypothetical protein|nr:hypothetical protein [Clostridiales bacterium]
MKAVIDKMSMSNENPFAAARTLGDAMLACDESLRYADAIDQFKNKNITINELGKAREDFYNIVTTCAEIVFNMVDYNPNEASACGRCVGGGGCARQAVEK